MALDIKSILSKKLVALSEGITPAERKEAEATIKISQPTLDKYLSGDIAKIDVAEKILEFFSPIVSKRIERIKAANI